MTSYIHSRRVYKETEYLFSAEEYNLYPHLARLLQQGYNFVVLRRCPPFRESPQYTYLLACEIICSNGTELLHRHEGLTPDFPNLADLEHFIRHNMIRVLHRHFFGRDLEVVR
ncbi:hypothetical protein DWB84_13045 [Saccharophagus sp. K07]|jgi:hypothetical protein|uniref:hypothetical protein n=1 Tax=Saccharophagus sp. K07 TaxID=2283636 RepID=UPI001652A9C8|nr:hypothetical protein [Saccharophagus sp. K07]MBC6906383.1 hypothetical protein [Saccharophagus sp. K07]